MAGDEGGGLFEEVVALLRWVTTGEKEAIDSAKRIERATKESQKSSQDLAAATLKIYKEMGAPGIQKLIETARATKRPIGDLIADLKSLGMTNKEIRTSLIEGGYAARQFNKALGETAVAGKRTDWSLRGIIKSLEWAAYRFLFALGVYMLFRKAIRGVNEAVADAIKLFEEFNIQQRQFNAMLSLSAQVVSGFKGDTKEWAKIIEELGDKYGYTTKKIYEVAQSIGRTNMALKLSDKQLADVIDMVVNFGRQLGYTGEKLPEFAGAFADAIEGSTKTWQDMSTIPMTDEIIEAWWRMAAGIKEGSEEAKKYVLTNLSEQQQAQLRNLYILSQITQKQRDYAYVPATTAAQVTEALQTEYEEQAAIAGRAAEVFKQIGMELKVLFVGFVDDFANLTVEFRARLLEIHGVWEWFQKVTAEQQTALRRPWQMTPEERGTFYKDLVGGFNAARDAAKGLADAYRQSFKDIQPVVRGSKEAAESLGDFGEQAKLIVPKVDAATDSISNLADQLFNVIFNAKQAQEKAYKDYMDSLDKLNKDEVDRREDIEANYADKAAELRKRAAEQIEDAQKDAGKREKDDRAEHLLHLKQMEQDYLLDVLQMRRQYEMDLEDAARTRDAVAIRRIQRQYGIQRKEREENYNLNRQQYIDSWELQHKQNQEDLNEEIQQIRDNLAEELAELEAAKLKELEELRQDYAERRTELGTQYIQQLEDLKRSNEQQLAEILARAVAEGEITRTKAAEITQFLADEYGFRGTDITNFVNLYLAEMARLEEGVVTKAAVIAAAMQAVADVVPVGWAKVEGMEKTQGFAEGGMAVATAPTMVKVGEAGPELFGAMPLNKLGGMGGGPMGMRGGMDIRLTIDGTQSGAWSGDFETQVLRVFRGILQESL